jgi:hypothetical protein
LEIDEGLQVGCDELVEAEYACHHDKEHQPEGHLGKPEAIAAFETLGEPVDEHTDDKDNYDSAVLDKHIRNL